MFIQHDDSGVESDILWEIKYHHHKETKPT